MKELLKKLVETPGVSGEESQIREVIREEIEDEADSLEVDSFGNLIARKESGDFTILLDAHMDQIGLSVKRITEEGYIKVSKVGGIYPENVSNQRMKVMASESDETIRGVLGQKPPHLARKGEGKPELPEMKEVFVDVGAKDKEHAKELGIRVGDRIVFEDGLAELTGDRVTGPAFDDRVGCAVAIEAFREFEQDYELVTVFSTQEEVGTKGAEVAAYGIDPDVALAVDVGMAGDHPTVEPDESNSSLGDGVGIDMIQAGGRGLVTPETVKKWLLDTAKENEHEYYRSLYDGGATNARSIEMVKEGIPTGSLSIPARYIHSSIEVAKISDMEETTEFVKNCFSTVEEYFGGDN